MAIEFRTISSPTPLVEYLSEVIESHLRADRHVLWLAAGGSAIEVAVDVSKLLGPRDLHNLVVTLTDERFGDIGHIDSNWQQLKQAGFSLSGASLIPVLKGRDLEATGRSFSDNLDLAMKDADYRIGLFGIGSDGHTAGILPGSPAAISTDMAVSYEDNDNHEASGVKRGISRITMSGRAIAQLDEAVVYATGEAKWPQLRLLADTIDVVKQPAQSLKLVSKLTIFTDMKKESV